MMKSNSKYAQRTSNIPVSFVREILKATDGGRATSFAGGLPSPNTFPVEQLKLAAATAIHELGDRIFQYGKTTGLEPLRQWISSFYWKHYQIKVDPTEILLTNGSQQGIDLIAKVFLDKGDGLVLEEPGYLGAIQAYHAYEPRFIPVPLRTNGMDINVLEQSLREHKVKIIHLIPNHQNPSGVSYTEENKNQVIMLAEKHDSIIVEDDPYALLGFDGYKASTPAIATHKSRAIHLGSFSKTVAPGLRLGWIVAKREWIEKLEIAKQSCDLHTNNLSQAMIYSLLKSIDFEKHLEEITSLYRERAMVMIQAIRSSFPAQTKFLTPKGGMFIWCELPGHIDTRDLLRRVMEQCVFVPGDVFHISNSGCNTMRLNFSNADEASIRRGIAYIGSEIKRM